MRRRWPRRDGDGGDAGEAVSSIGLWDKGPFEGLVVVGAVEVGEDAAEVVVEGVCAGG